jgi:NADH:ubiquinone oxidoreductase subunit H
VRGHECQLQPAYHGEPPEILLDSPLADALVVTLDLVAVVAVLAFAALCLTLSRSLQGSALRRGFTFAGLAGLVHFIANILQVVGDFGLVASEVPPVVFSGIQAVFFVMMALAVRSFFPVWFRAFKKDGSQAFGTGAPQAPMQR